MRLVFLAMMKCLIIFSILIGIPVFCTAQQVFPLKDLTVGNRFVYRVTYNESYPNPVTIPPERDTNFRYYEHVLRDTVINAKRYGIVFRSFDRSISIERSDDTTVYVWNNGVEKPVLRWNMNNGDSLDINFLGFRYNGIISRIDRYKTMFYGDSTMIFSVDNYFYEGPIFDPRYNNRAASASIVFLRPLGITQINMGVRGLPRYVVFGIDRMLQGAVIKGQVYQDTNTRNTRVDVLQTTAVVTALNNIPNPFSESVNLEYTLASAVQKVELRITSTAGETIASFKQGAKASGKYALEWNGKTADGREAPQGAYFVSLIVNGRKQQDVKVMKAK